MKELRGLHRVRLEHDLTYDELSRRIGVSTRTIHRLFATPDVRVHERTLFKIQRFLRDVSRGAAA